MSEENVEIVRSIYDAWAKGDFSSAEWADPDIEFVTPDDGLETRGAEPMAKKWGEFLGVWTDYAVLPEEFRDAGDRVLVFVRFRGTGKGSGAPLGDFAGANLFTVQNGKVTRLVLYSDRAEALEASGLSNS